MTDTMKALDDLIISAKLLQQNSIACVKVHHGFSDIPGWLIDTGKTIESAGPTLRAALAPPADGAGEVEAIRARHEAALARMADNNWPVSEGRQDVAALLALVDKMRAGQ